MSRQLNRVKTGMLVGDVMEKSDIESYTESSKKYYFFGAGNNCLGAIDFFGADNVIAVVDNSTAKIGTYIKEILIISFEDFKHRWNGEKIIITANVRTEEIKKQLEKEGISDYFVCPYMQSGFYNCDELIDRLELLDWDHISIYGDNPIGRRLGNSILSRKKCNIKYVSADKIDSSESIKSKVLVIAEFGADVNRSLMECHYAKILNLFEEIEKLQSKDFGYLEKYKNIHSSGRCFLIGNGPSLTEKDLDKIYENKVISIGCNKINMIFTKTRWRPEYYVVGDSLVWDEEKDNIKNDIKYFVRKITSDVKPDYCGNVQLYYAKFENYYPGYPTFSDDMTKGVYGGRTVMYDMLQIAVYMGFKEIYLLGVDFSWGEDGRDTHFCKDYMNDDLVRDGMKYKEEERHAYISAKNYADAHGIKIYNATRGGHLDVFEKVNFDDLFEEEMK